MIHLTLIVFACVRFVKQITVEPVAFLFFSGYILQSIAGVQVLYYKICKNQYSHVGGIDCVNLGQQLQFKEIEDDVQSQATAWSMYISVAYTLCAIPACLLMSAWGDLEGRKINMLVSLAGASIITFFYLLEVQMLQLPLWILPVVSAIVGTTGLVGLMGNSIFQYVTDIVEDKQYLVIRMTIIGCCIGVGGIVGGAAGGLMIGKIGFAWTLVVGLVFFVLATFYTLAYIEMKPCRAVQEMKEKSEVDLAIGPYTAKLLKDVYLAYARKREGKKQLYLFAAVAISFLYCTTEMGLQSINTLFAKHLGFTPGEIGALNAVSSVCGIVMTLVAVGITKKLQWSDTSIILLSFTSAFLKLLLSGLSHSKWMLWIATLLGGMQMIGFAALQAFIAKNVDPVETGKIIAGMGISANIASLVASIGYSSIYRSTQGTYAGSVYFAAAGIVVIAAAIVIWVHVDSRLENSKLKKQQIGNINAITGNENAGFETTATDEYKNGEMRKY